MSTLTSADFGELKRPTTRVHAPPGGGSQWNFGHEQSAVPAPTRREVNTPMQLKQNDNVTHVTPVPVAQAAMSKEPKSAVALRVALIMSMESSNIMEQYVQLCASELQSFADVTVEIHTVPMINALLYAANKLLRFGGVDGAIVFCFVGATDKSLTDYLSQSMDRIGVKTFKPVVPVFVTDSLRYSTSIPEEQVLRSRNSAKVLIDLVRCGGFVCRNGAAVSITQAASLPVLADQNMNMDVSENESVSSGKPSSVAGFSDSARSTTEQVNFKPKFQQPRKKQYGAGESSVFFG